MIDSVQTLRLRLLPVGQQMPLVDGQSLVALESLILEARMSGVVPSMGVYRRRIAPLHIKQIRVKVLVFRIIWHR